MQVTVRPATTVDATSAAEVLRAVAEERRWVLTEPPVDVEALAGRVRAMIIGEAERLWVVEEEGRIVGSLGLQVAAVAGLRTIGIAILAEARGRGYGRRLLETALEEAPATGARRSSLRSSRGTGRRSPCTPRRGSSSRAYADTTTPATTGPVGRRS